ncbi:MAG: VCBS repeat-containing protein [Myxococcales bacterium]|nr:VCBS repeat-containing protein [Myxococcales bacterium]
MRHRFGVAVVAASLAASPVFANDAVRLAGEINPEGGVNLGDALVAARVLAGLRTLTDAERKTADVAPCSNVDLGGADPAPHPAPCAPSPDGAFDANDLRVILNAATGRLAIAPVLGYTQQLDGILADVPSPVLFAGGTGRPTVTFEDFDGDGDPEMISMGSESLMRFFTNSGVSTPAGLEWGGFLPYADGSYRDVTAAVSAADLDGDGNPDLIGGVNRRLDFARFTGLDAQMRPVFERSIALRDTGGTALEASGNAQRPALGDFNGDAEPDIVTGYFGGLDYFENNGDGTPGTPATFTDRGQLPPLALSGGGFLLTGFPAPGVGDLNGDGDPDLLVSQNNAVHYFQGLGTLSPSGIPEFADGVPLLGPGPQTSITGIAVGLFDADAVPDAITVSDSPPTYVYFHGIDTTPSFAAGVAFEPGGTTLLTASQAYVTSANLVGGPLQDLVVTDGISNHAIYRTRALAPTPSLGAPVTFTLTRMGPRANGRPVFVDLDGDGDQDCLVLADENGAIYSFEQTAAGDPPTFTYVDDLSDGGTLIQVPGSALGLAAGDIDGDGDPDLVAASSDSERHFWILQHKDGPTPDNFRTAWKAPVEADVLGGVSDFVRHALLDIDEDGDLDIVGWTNNSTLVLFLNIGDPTTPRFTSEIPFPYPEPFTTARSGGGGGVVAFDVGSDGDRDLLIGDGEGGVLLWRSVQAD